MAWIKTVTPAEATGSLKKMYDAAINRAGRVFGIVQAMSLSPSVLSSSLKLYERVMFAETGLSRRQREMLAVVTSAANNCHY